jgi:hypothetical protein
MESEKIMNSFIGYIGYLGRITWNGFTGLFTRTNAIEAAVLTTLGALSVVFCYIVGKVLLAFHLHMGIDKMKAEYNEPLIVGLMLVVLGGLTVGVIFAIVFSFRLLWRNYKKTLTENS